ncbi:protein containg double zinc ribbon/zinc-ribbon domain [Longilinea arvoryzae]|uniref:Protein containg double zinc ribbon/zinc-ribbon domain n=1 Tax=Longilinea arvoryzae TaxID=360412 RepID=A0A0S7BKE4_9CHLR|nr:zinc ribbon domain-containing protein [Longilinea arvoryzae]GAP14289.1 protein containg double zinc ribbon/zinc-ribbon domain [Longilinea arvoryzae]
MPRESLGYVRMVWYCPNCQSKNPGNFRFCRGCGAAQPANVEFQKDDQDVLVTDAKEIEQAELGADIHCGYCGARNPANARECLACGADLATGTPRASGTMAGALNTGPVAMQNCPACGSPNPATALTCSKCGASLKSAPAQAQPSLAKPASFPKWLPFAFIGLTILCILLAVILTRTTDQIGTVSALAWQRSYPILAQRAVEHEDWKDQIPQDAILGVCEERKAGVSDQPTDRSVKVCGTPYTIDKGNGYSEVVQDCQYEVYADYCSYTVQEWVTVDNITTSGSDLNPYWPQLNLAADQRAGDGSEQYRITFSTEDGNVTYETADAALFGAAEPGSRWTLRINSLGEIVTIEPAP